MNAILDNQIRQLGFWSAVIFLVTVVVSLVLPLDVPNGLDAEFADRVIWLYSAVTLTRLNHRPAI